MVKIFNKSFFFVDILTEIFGINKQDFSLEHKIESIIIPVSEEILKKQYNWAYLLGKSGNYKDILKQFRNKLSNWEQRYNELTEKDITSYLDKYIQDPYTKVKIEKGTISINQLKENLLVIKPKIFHFYKSMHSNFHNFIIFETPFFHLNLHLRLTKKLTKTFECLAIFSMWFKAPESFSVLNIEWINGIYQPLLLGYELSQLLENNFYSNESLWNIENYNSQNYKGRDLINPWAIEKPFIFVTHVKLLLNSNPVKLFQDLAEEISQITEICENFMKTEIQSPKQYYKIFNSKLDDFLKRGSVLFHKAEHIHESFSKKEPIYGEVDYSKKLQKKSSLTPEILYSLFEVAYDKDKTKSLEDRGYWSLNKIYKEFGKDYNFSKQTVYNCFKDSDLEFKLENRDTVGQGGGKQYRIKRIVIEKEEDFDQFYLEELMKIEEAIIYFNQEDYEKCQIYFKDILKTPSKKLKENTPYFNGSKYYLGKSYFQQQDYINAQKYFEQVLKNTNQLFDVRYFLMLCYHKNREKIKLQESVEENITIIYDIFKRYGITFEEHKNLIREKLTLTGDESHKLFKNISYDSNLSEFVILINSKEIEHRIVIFSSLNKEKDMVFYNQNILAYENLRKCLSRAILLKIEILRQKIFENIISNNKDEITDLLNDFFTIIQNRMTSMTIHKNYFHILLLYFRNQLEYYSIEFDINDYEENIKKFDSNFDFKKIYVLNFPNELKFISNFISTININHEIKYRDQDQDTSFSSLSVKPTKFEFPEYNLEHILTEYLNIKNSNTLQKYLEEITREYKNVQTRGTLEIEDLREFWSDFRLPYNKYALISKFQQTIHKAVELIKTHDLSVFKTIFEDIKNEVDNFAQKIEKIRKSGSKLTVNKIFEILQAKYLPKESIDQIDLLTIPEEYDGDLFSQLNEIILNFFEDVDGMKILLLNFNNIEMKKEGKRLIIKLLINRVWKTNFRLKLLENTSNTSINLTYEAVLYLGDDFRPCDILEAIFGHIIIVIEKNQNQVIINSKKVSNDEFNARIKEILTKELQNDHFTFKIDKIEKEDEILITIKKK